MQSRRRTSRFDASTPALTPASQPTLTGLLTRSELVGQNADLKRLLTAERQRNAKIEQVLVKQLDTLQASLDAVRAAYIEQVAPKPTGRQQ